MILLPSYYKERRDFLHFEAEEFQKKLQSFLDENSSVDRPYLVTYKQAFDKKDPSKARESFVMSFRRPKFVTNSMVFFVDNKTGTCVLLWRVDGSGKIKFNLKAAEKLKGSLRVADD